VKPAKVTVKVTEPAEGTPITTSTVVVTSSDRFGKFAARSSHYLGSRWAFVVAIGVILVWGLSGPFFHY